MAALPGTVPTSIKAILFSVLVVALHRAVTVGVNHYQPKFPTPLTDGLDRRRSGASIRCRVEDKRPFRITLERHWQVDLARRTRRRRSRMIFINSTCRVGAELHAQQNQETNR